MGHPAKALEIDVDVLVEREKAAVGRIGLDFKKDVIFTPLLNKFEME